MINILQRCEQCDELRDTLKKLSQNLKETEMIEVVIAEADCCIETDLCDTTDRTTKCISDQVGGSKFW